ncbi:MAG: UDP-N-acetylmuramate--L-alanine ligase [Candidatus Kerfeldbacteria bacterium]|nr:UDP-N-acetylmuramate--L-alanine ligase [Candidatus Kerfeldbacteria bacterium]
MNLPSLRRVYCLGLGGVGVSAVAKYLLRHGISVAGSDPVRSPLTADVEALGGRHFVDVDPQRLSPDVDLVIYSDACPPDHPELVAARRLGRPVMTFAESLGAIMHSFPRRVIIAGTNGKSTTTALTGLLLESAGLNPTVFVGSRLSSFNGNLRFGGQQVFVAEGDEYRQHFHQLEPTILTLTNLEPDHLDFFHNLPTLIASFDTMVGRLDRSGRLVLNIDDPIIRRQWGRHPARLTFGFNRSADVVVEDYRTAAGRQLFRLRTRQGDLGQFILHVPGRFNVMNVVAAVATALSTGAEPQQFIRTVAAFRGIWRRFELLNPQAAVTVVNDYAHHPTAVRGTLEGAKSFFPGRRLIAVFQPHHHIRLATLFTDFCQSFRSADLTIVSEVYAVLGREEPATKTSRDLTQALRRQGQSVEYAATVAEAGSLVRRLVQPGDVVVIMGAGDIWRLAQSLAAEYV